MYDINHLASYRYNSISSDLPLKTTLVGREEMSSVINIEIPGGVLMVSQDLLDEFVLWAVTKGHCRLITFSEMCMS